MTVTNSEFKKCLKIVLELEGGYSDVKGDRGGKTNYGVTQGTYSAYLKSKNLSNKDVNEITLDEVETIYYEEFWERSNCSSYQYPMNLFIFDCAVHSGPGRSREFTKSINGLSDTEKNAYIFLAKRFVQLKNISDSPSQQKFFKGWMSRLSKLAKAAGF